MMLRGFTLIELVIVIVLLGVLSVVALPKFLDLTSDAKQSAVQGVAGALSSANAINYAARKANGTLGVGVSNCTALASALAGGLPTSYVITSTAVTLNTPTTCTLTYFPASGTSVTATFTATGI